MVYSPGDLVLKAIYAEAFKDASNFNRYATAAGIRDLQNPFLKPEKMENFELALGWEGAARWSTQTSIYQATYSGAVGQVRVPFQGGSTVQNQNVGALKIHGLTTSARYRREGFGLFANYSWTEPKNLQPRDSAGDRYLDPDGRPIAEVRLGDIAEHRLNLGLDLAWRVHFEFDLRLSWVGDRDTFDVCSNCLPGGGTRDGEPPAMATVGNPLREIDAYLDVNATLTWKDPLPASRLQLVLRNLLDSEYEHPGVRSADGRVFATSQPQNERSIFLRWAVGF